MKLGSPKQAENDFKEALSKYATGGKLVECYKDEVYRIYYNRGINYYLNLKNSEEAIKSLKSAIGAPNLLNEEKSAAYNYLGLSHFELRQYTDAIKQFKKSIESSTPKMAVHFNNRGLAYYHMCLYE